MTFLLSAGLNIDGIANRFSFCCFLLFRLRPKRALNVGIVGAAIDIGVVDIAAVVADREDFVMIVFGGDINVDEKAPTEEQVAAMTKKHISLVINDHVGRLLVLDIIVIVATTLLVCWLWLIFIPHSKDIEDTALQKIRMLARHEQGNPASFYVALLINAALKNSKE